MKSLFSDRTLYYWVRFFLLVCFFTYSCQSKEYEIVYEDPPIEDFEAYGVLLHVLRPTENAELVASEYREFNKDKHAIASGNVAVLLRGADDENTVKFISDFLKLDHEKRKWFLSEGVEVQLDDNVSVFSDSLIWDIELDQLRMPDSLLIEHLNGREKGTNFQSNSSAKTWQLSDVDGYWISSDVDDTIHVVANTGQGHYLNGELQVSYSDAVFRTLGMELFASKAYWETENFVLSLADGVNGVNGGTYFDVEQMEVSINEHQFEAKGPISISSDSVSILAEGWKENRIIGETEVWGVPANYYRGLANIQGRRLTYREKEDLLFVDSMGVFQDTEYHITARKMTFNGNDQKLNAKNDVEVRNSNWDGIFKGQHLTLNLKKNSGDFDGSPQLIYSQEVFVFSANRMQFNGALNEVTGIGSVLFKNESLIVESDKAVLSQDGNQIVFYENVEIEEGRIEDNYTLGMSADTLKIDLVDGKVMRANLGGELFGIIDSKSEYISSISGKSGTAFFLDEHLTEIELNTNAGLTYGKGLTGIENQFKGQIIKLIFNKHEGLSNVFVDGNAELLSLREESNESEDVNHVFAEEMNAYFKDGRIENIEIGPSAQGIYITEDTFLK